jgi:two-component system, cell cycle response regulator
VTLRARLTGAFLAVVLGPVLIGGVFVGMTVTETNHAGQRDRLTAASVSVTAAVSATCARLTAASEAAAAATVGGRLGGVSAIVAQGRATAVHLEDTGGKTILDTANLPAPPWVMCGPAPSAGAGMDAVAIGNPGDDHTALAAAVQMSSTDGGVIGYAYALQTLDASYVRSLAAATGVGVTVMNAGGLSSESATTAAQESKAAGKLGTTGGGGSRIASSHDRYVLRVDPQPGQPLQLAISARASTAHDLLAVAAAIVLFCVLVALAAAWLLARATTRSLHEITEAASRVADGDLDARAPVRHDDEIGHLGAAVNRITREMQSYASALSASRDQLRGNLVLIGDTLASTHDLPRILDVILVSAITATSAQSGVVMLADPSDDRLRLECSHGFDEHTAAKLAPLIVPFGDGLLGRVAASGGAERGRRSDSASSETGAIETAATTGVDVTGPHAEGGEPSCETYLAVALQVGPTAGDQAGIRGVLALYDRLGGVEFDEADLQTVQTFASHAAVAVDNVRQHDEAKRLSHTDPLTGLYNYRHLKDLLRREVNRAYRFRRKLAVLVMDLDRFKEVNDTYGHAAGDAILVEFARRVGAEIRGVDLAFRYGGEEFVLLLPDTDGLGGMTVAQRLGAAVRDTPVIAPAGHGGAGEGTVEVSVRVSIGVAVYPDHGRTGVKVLEAADDALYAAKAAGRDTHRLADSPREEPSPPPMATPAALTAADVRGDVALEVETVIAPLEGGSGGTSPTPPPPRQARGR